MNLIDATITKILTEPHYEYGKWWVMVEINAYGSKSETTIMKNSLDEIESVKVGDTMSDLELVKEKGYYVRVTSWENDADNYKTEEIHVETKAEALFILDVCKLFQTTPYGGSDKDHFGNANIGSEFTEEIFEAKLNESIYPNYPNLLEDYYDVDYVDECIRYELVGSWGEGDFMRVFESGNVYYYENSVYAEKIA